MTLQVTAALRASIDRHLESAYPDEGAGFLLGREEGVVRIVAAVLPVANAREAGARRNRYFITPQDMLAAELEAEKQELDILGVFHSHPDCPNVPSGFDLEWALPWYSYAIIRVDEGRAVSLRSWRLAEDRKSFKEEDVGE